MASVCTSQPPALPKRPHLRLFTATRFIAAPISAALSAFALAAIVTGSAGCADTKPAVQYGADQLLSMWNESMRDLADKHAGCPYDRDLPFNHRSGACYPLKCRNSGDEVSLLRKNDGYIYKCDAGCDGGCSSISRF